MFEFFLQIGRFFQSIASIIVNILQGLMAFVTTIFYSLEYAVLCLSLLPEVLLIGFLVLLCATVIYLIVGR